MKNYYTYLLLMVAILVCSCAKQTDPPINTNPIEITIDEDVDFIGSSLSVDNAIDNANFIYNYTESNKTRRIKDVTLLTSDDLRASVATRSGSANNDKNIPLAYIVNYADNKGYAILAADTQLPPVIAIGDSGVFSTDGFLQYISGEYNTRLSEELNPAQELQYTMVNNSLTLNGLPTIDNQITPTLARDTTMILKCMPLVPTKWGQGNPYNYYSPLDEDGNKCVAGCVPVAGAQVLASLCYHHNFYPATQIHSEYPVDWIKINKMIFQDSLKYNYNEITPSSKNVASLIRAIGKSINATYTTDATSAYTSNLGNVYSDLGMTSIVYGDSDVVTLDNLFNMIVSKNYPVNARATRIKEDNETVGHSFVLDGWLRLEYSFIGSTHLHGEFSVGIINNIQSQFDLVHVNFGWNGVCDGYYHPGSFDTSSDEFHDYAEEDDNAVVRPYNYDIDVRYLTYEL